MQIAYVVLERFTSSDPGWPNYVKFSGYDHLDEVVGLDQSLCRAVVESYTAEDWRHLVSQYEHFAAFDDLEYARKRSETSFDARKHQVLAIAREPGNAEVAAAQLPGFTFVGYDLVEVDGSTSALTNCGGFESAFDRGDVSTCGLVKNAERAYEIRDRLRLAYPEDSHADCAVWAVWRLDLPE